MQAPASPDVECPECGRELAAAESSCRVSADTVRWHCPNCGHRFEIGPTLSPDLVEQFLPNLVVG
jgi:predicted RNA-binding Zn-ribbon protein involved in translation (DUF1610 family)